MPLPGSKVKFHKGQNQFKVPFIMYADFESILKKVDSDIEETKDGMEKIHIQKRLISISPLDFAFTASLHMVKLKTQ